MTITDEPGIYEEGLVGVRIDNELLVVEHMETKYGKFYAFQPFTYLPIDTTPVVLELMKTGKITVEQASINDDMTVISREEQMA